MSNKYRLTASVFEREKEQEKIDPQKIYFLSVEGNITEKEYFEGVSANRTKLRINAKVDVEVLKRSRRDNRSAPKQVIELLEEYIRLRDIGKEDFLEDMPKSLVSEYGTDFIKQYLNEPETISKKDRNAFETELAKIGYNISYRRYLQKYDGDYDEFAILIDRDIQTHSEKSMKECVCYCRKRGYSCYISNPCFEFWLLLHVSDVKEEYKNKLDLIQTNEKVSAHHTFVSKELSGKVHHGKSGINFKNNYLPNIDMAIERAKIFESDEEALVVGIGSNIWKLIESMRSYKEQKVVLRKM